MVAIQALVAAGMGVATIPGLALRAHHHPDVHAYEIPDAARHVYVATYGEPPDPPATAALVNVLVSVA
jgi:DNA-binding transcriptional LysR family regulator